MKSNIKKILKKPTLFFCRTFRVLIGLWYSVFGLVVAEKGCIHDCFTALNYFKCSVIVHGIWCTCCISDMFEHLEVMIKYSFLTFFTKLIITPHFFFVKNLVYLVFGEEHSTVCFVIMLCLYAVIWKEIGMVI